MRLKTISFGLLGGGIVMLFYALTMDVSVSGMYNLNKGSDRNLVMVLGGFVFLGGIITLVASRFKVEEQKPREPVWTKEDTAEAKELAHQAFEATGKAAKTVFTAIGRKGETKRQTVLRVVGSGLAAILFFYCAASMSVPFVIDDIENNLDTFGAVSLLGFCGAIALLVYLYLCQAFATRLQQVAMALVGMQSIAVGFLTISLGVPGFLTGFAFMLIVVAVGFLLRFIGRKWNADNQVAM